MIVIVGKVHSDIYTRHWFGINRTVFNHTNEFYRHANDLYDKTKLLGMFETTILFKQSRSIDWLNLKFVFGDTTKYVNLVE